MTMTVTAIKTTGVAITFWNVDPRPFDRPFFYSVLGPNGNYVDAGIQHITQNSTACQFIVVTGGILYSAGTYKVRCYLPSDDPTAPITTPVEATFDYP